jgi:6-pyruvoyltetrahydropterin/6-carboxytetrahydropterin synthase
MTIAERYHDFSAGHRVAGHESKCAHLHGHNYRVYFKVASPELDSVGRILDFSVIKERLCLWLEDNWDHKFLLWEHDPLHSDLKQLVPNDIVTVPFNPTAENMAQYLVNEIAVDQLAGTGCILIECKIEETRKCSVTYSLLK